MPLKIIQYWEGPLNTDVAELIDTWRRHRGTFEHQLYNKNDALLWLRSNWGEDVVRAFENAALPAMASDIFRVAYIARCGGLYVDAATLCTRRVDDWLNSIPGSLILVRKWHGGVWNGFIYSSGVNNKFLVELLRLIVHNVSHRISDNVWEVTGPGAWKKARVNETFGISIISQIDLKQYFQLMNKLSHKDDTHWSKVQGRKSIYRDSFPRAKGGGRKIWLHLGPHKTGTTYIQSILEKIEPSLFDIGCKLITVRSSSSGSYKDARIRFTRVLQGYLLSGKPLNDVVVERLTAALVEIFDTAGGDKVILSDENLMGPLLGHHFAGDNTATGPYDALPLLVSAIERLVLVHGYQVERILLLRRDYSQWLQSVYKDYIRKLRLPISPMKFIERIRDDASSTYEKLFEKSEWGKLSESLFIANFSALHNMRNVDVVEKTLNLLGLKIEGRHRDVFSDPKNFDGNFGTPVNQGLSWREVEFLIDRARLNPSLAPQGGLNHVLAGLSESDLRTKASDSFMKEVDLAFVAPFRASK